MFLYSYMPLPLIGMLATWLLSDYTEKIIRKSEECIYILKE